MVASDSMASFATIESPEGTTGKGMMSAMIRGDTFTCLMYSAR
jgi:hypothetical protein